WSIFVLFPDAYFDLLCPVCQFTWPTVLQLLSHYDSRIHFIFHTFPLPYFTNSFLASQGLHLVANLTNHNLTSIYTYITMMYQEQEQWRHLNTRSMTMNQVIESMADFVERNGIIKRDQFIRGINNNHANGETRIAWKYVCSRGISGTPVFLLNGVYVDEDEWLLEDWQTVIDPLLKNKH
ncbi:unnamed protein product, partial [Didymodactylos carnosus]